MAFALTWLADVLRAANLKVAEVDGWQGRGRADMGELRGIVCHHTATKQPGNMPSLGTLINGRAATATDPALPGPLAQLGLGRDGTYYVIAAGKANHAGKGAWANVSGNSHFIGIEAENSGSADDAWPDVQMDAYRRGAAAILQHAALPSTMCCGHKEYAPGRKVDPSFEMDPFRAAVQALMQGAGNTRPLIAVRDAQGHPTTRRGDQGDAVRTLQEKLGAPVDGAFGPQTEADVRAFQRKHDLVPDGIVGPATWAALLAS